MKQHRFRTQGVLIAALVLGAQVAATSAAAAPVTVNLRVEGSSSTIFEGPVTTDAKMIDGHPCDGTNGGVNATPGPTMTSALDDASIAHGFPWTRTWFDSLHDFNIDSVGHDASNSTQFWGYAYNWQSASVGGCQQEVHNGDEVLYAFDFFSKTHLLKLSGPGTAKVGQPVDLTVVDGQDNSPVSGATVGGATTGADGTASVSYASPGVVHLKAEQSDSVRSNDVDVCIYASSASECAPPPTTPPATADTVAPNVAVKGIANHKHFKRGKGPRKLAGTASDAGGLFQVYFRLRRFTHHGCQWYSSKRSVFTRKRAHCTARYQRLGTDAKWSYLLPKRLPQGSYILDTKALDKAFNVARERVEFTVAG